MRLLRRNLKTVYYSNWGKSDTTVDDNGYETGEMNVTYGNPIRLDCNVSRTGGEAEIAMFGTLSPYDRILVIGDPNIDIDENTVFFIERVPSSVQKNVSVINNVMMISNASVENDIMTVDGYVEDDIMYFNSGSDDQIDTFYDYIVKRVAKSLNCTSVLVTKVRTS